MGTRFIALQRAAGIMADRGRRARSIDERLRRGIALLLRNPCAQVAPHHVTPNLTSPRFPWRGSLCDRNGSRAGSPREGPTRPANSGVGASPKASRAVIARSIASGQSLSLQEAPTRAFLPDPYRSTPKGEQAISRAALSHVERIAVFLGEKAFIDRLHAGRFRAMEQQAHVGEIASLPTDGTDVSSHLPAAVPRRRNRPSGGHGARGVSPSDAKGCPSTALRKVETVPGS
jgi:hypothetical protein